MNKLIIEDQWSVFSGEDSDKIVKFLSIVDRRYNHVIREYETGDPVIFINEHGEFRTGLIDLVLNKIKILEENGEISSTHISDLRTKTPKISKVDLLTWTIETTGMTPRAYQLEAVDTLVKKHRGVWDCAVNAGKTLMAAMAIRRISRKTIYLVPKGMAYLADQVYHIFADWFGHKNVSLVRSSDVVDNDIVVAAADTVCAKMRKDDLSEWLNKFQFVIYDEAHATSGEIEKLLDNIFAVFRLGMSGTPFGQSRIRNMRTMSHFGPVIYRVTNSKLIDDGISAKPYIAFYKINDYPKIDRRRYEYFEVYDKFVRYNTVRHRTVRFIVDMLTAYGLTVVVTVVNLDHAEALSEQIPGSVIYTGNECAQDRKDISSRIEDGSVSVIIASSVFETGISIKNIGAIVVAGGLKVNTKTFQRIGRGQRKKELNKLLVIDLWDNVLYMYGQGKKRHLACSSEKSFYVEVVENMQQLETFVKNSLIA